MWLEDLNKEQTWVRLWKIFNYRAMLKRIYVGLLIWPFLKNFWLNPTDKVWDEWYIKFQDLLLSCFEFSKIEQYVDESWYEIIFNEDIDYELQNISTIFNLGVLEYIEKTKSIYNLLIDVENWKLSFWFFPVQWMNKVKVIFAKLKPIPISFITSLAKEQISDALTPWFLPKISNNDLKELTKQWWDFENFTL